MMLVKLSKEVIEFKTRRRDNFIRVHFFENDLEEHMKKILSLDKSSERFRCFDKYFINFFKENIFLVVGEKDFGINKNFYKLLHDGKLFWAHSEMFIKIY